MLQVPGRPFSGPGFFNGISSSVGVAGDLLDCLVIELDGFGVLRVEGEADGAEACSFFTLSGIIEPYEFSKDLDEGGIEGTEKPDVGAAFLLLKGFNDFTGERLAIHSYPKERKVVDGAGQVLERECLTGNRHLKIAGQIYDEAGVKPFVAIGRSLYKTGHHLIPLFPDGVRACYNGP